MAGRDEGTGALIEPRNIDQQGLCTCHNRHSPNIIMYLRFCETKNAPHTEILTLPWFGIEIINSAGKTTYRNSFVTDLPVGPDTVVDLAACGRARWKIKNETFNVLKNNGYNLEHNFGHGKINLAATLASLNLLAFAFHTACDIADQLWQNAREKLRPRYNFFSKLAAITAYIIFPSWDDLLLTLAFAKPPPLPP